MTRGARTPVSQMFWQNVHWEKKVSKFEYKIIQTKIESSGFFSADKRENSISITENEINRLGEKGWELVNVLHLTENSSHVCGALHYFKKLKEN